MAEPEDLQALAQRYLDLWQEQLARLAADRDMAELTARTLEVMNSGLTAFAAMAPAMAAAARGKDATPADDHSRPAPAAAGTAPAGAAPGGDGDDVAELARRLAALEERVARLESGRGGGRPGARARPRRRRS